MYPNLSGFGSTREKKVPKSASSSSSIGSLWPNLRQAIAFPRTHSTDRYNVKEHHSIAKSNSLRLRNSETVMERGGPRGSYPASYPSAPTSRALDLQTEGSNSSIATIMASAVSPTANVAPSVLENDSSDEYHTSATFRETRQFRMTQRAKDVLLDDMYTMFLERDKYGADFKFKVGQRVFKCHKAILMVRLKTYCSSWSEKVGVIILPKDFESEAMEG